MVLCFLVALLFHLLLIWSNCEKNVIFGTLGPHSSGTKGLWEKIFHTGYFAPYMNVSKKFQPNLSFGYRLERPSSVPVLLGRPLSIPSTSSRFAIQVYHYSFADSCTSLRIRFKASPSNSCTSSFFESPSRILSIRLRTSAVR